MENNKNNNGIRCLIFKFPKEEGGKWRAIALEMDIWGIGNSREEARNNLEELIETQIEFATGYNELEALDHPADEKWLQLWEEFERLGQNVSDSQMGSPQKEFLVVFRNT